MIDITWSERSALPKPEPEPNWKSMYEQEQEAHKFTRELLENYKQSYKDAHSRIEKLETALQKVI